MSFSKNKVLALVFVTCLSLFAYYQTTPQIIPPTTQRLLTTTYTTTTARSTSVNTFCTGKSRNDLIDVDQKSLYNFFSQQMTSSFTIDGNSLFVNAINGQTDQVQTKLKQNTTALAMFIGPYIIGLVIIILISPFLLCCCACPESCPSKCCRKNQQEQYTSCQLYWPTVCMVLALLLAIGSCIAGFSNSESITKNIDSNLCSISIVLDDMMNGNVTNSGTSFFIGLKQLSTQLGHLNGNITSINNTMATIKPASSNISTTITRGNTALSDVQKIPNNVNSGGNMPALSYSTPFTSASPTGTINSIFPAQLGSSNTGGFTGTMYKIIQNSIAYINKVSNAALQFNNQAANFQSGITALRTKVTQFYDFIVISDNNVYNVLKKVFENKSLIALGVKLVYGITIAFATLMLLGGLMVAFCDKTKFRYLIYSTCFFLFLIGTLGFFLTVIFSIITPITFFGCQFINYSISSAANFNSNFNTIMPNATYRSLVSTCLPTQSGDLLKTFGGISVNALLNLSDSVVGMNNFNVLTEANYLLNNMTNLKNNVSNYQKSNIADIDDTASLNFLKDISQPSSYSSCLAAGFTSDSWIPSTNQNPSYISCKVSGNNAISTSCSGTFTSRGGTCNGCMDTTSVLSGYTTKSSLLTDLGSRYSGCTTFNNDLSNIWNNYYRLKKSSFAPVTARVTTAQAAVSTYANTIINTIQPTFTNAMNSLNTISSTVNHPTYGLVAGLNCKLIGQDFQRTFDTFCQSLFTITYYTRLVVGLVSFGILFSMCCGVCTGVRYMKNQTRRLNCPTNKGIDDQAVQDITNYNFVIPKVLQ